MNSPTALADIPTERRNPSSPSNDRFVPIDAVLQIGLTLVLFASLWLFLGPDGNSPWHHRLTYAVLCIGYTLVVIVGVSSQTWASRTKWFVGAAILLAPLPIVGRSLIEREMSFRLLEPARIENRQVVHPGLGLSYAAIPDWHFKLQPVLTRERTQVIKSAPLPSHLRYGDVVMLGQFVQPNSSPTPGASPTSISVFVQHDWGAGSSAFVNTVRQFESRVEKTGNNRVRQKTHHVPIAGADALQFEYLQTTPLQINRQLFVRVGRFVVYFVMSTDYEANCKTFDEFSKSIRVKSVLGR